MVCPPHLEDTHDDKYFGAPNQEYLPVHAGPEHGETAYGVTERREEGDGGHGKVRPCMALWQYGRGHGKVRPCLAVWRGAGEGATMYGALGHWHEGELINVLMGLLF